MRTGIHRPEGVLAWLLLAVLVAGALPGLSFGQGMEASLGPGPTFDWSDYRGTARGRVYLARLNSLTFSDPVLQTRLPEATINRDVQPFQEIWGVLYIDRLGLRINMEDRLFAGRREDTPSAVHPRLYPELNLGTSRLGLDLDIIRYPFLKLGIDYDFQLVPISLRHYEDEGSEVTQRYASYVSPNPMTIGAHAAAIPCRFGEIPVTVQARGRFPIPFLEKLTDMGKARITDWEISAGLRPVVWEISFIGSSTFSLSVEAGYRSVTIDTPLTLQKKTEWATFNLLPKEVDMRATWQGAFFQLAAYF